MAEASGHAGEPTLAGLFELAKDNIMSELRCVMPGEIVSFNPEEQTAEARIMMQRRKGGEILEYPMLVDCPCVVLGGGDSRITFPIKAGDGCIVLFADRDIDSWYAEGKAMPPRTNRRHSISDAFILVGIRHRKNKISDYYADGMEIRQGDFYLRFMPESIMATDGTAEITIGSGKITLKSGATSMEISGSGISLTGNVSITGSIKANGTDIGEGHTHSGVLPGDSSTGPVA